VLLTIGRVDEVADVLRNVRWGVVGFEHVQDEVFELVIHLWGGIDRDPAAAFGEAFGFNRIIWWFAQRLRGSWTIGVEFVSDLVHPALLRRRKFFRADVLPGFGEYGFKGGHDLIDHSGRHITGAGVVM